MYVISFNYRNSNVVLRNKLSALKLNDFADFKEVLLLKTCNRIEIIFDKKRSINELYDKVFCSVISPEEMLQADIYEGEDAIEHIFKVASSLDSMVVGETQITGQLKDAFYEAYDNHYIGQNLTRLIHFSFKCAKKVRNKTQISVKPVSVASIAVKKSKELLKDLSGYSAIVVGVGDTAKIICKNLIKENVNILLVNRTVENAFALKEELGDEVNIDIHSLDSLPKLVNNYRLLFTATSSDEPIIKKEFIKETKFKRLWFDLAIPNDIDNLNCENITLLRVDDLREISNENLKTREEELKKANKLIKKCVEDFYKYLQSVSVEPVIKLLNKKAKESIELALNNAIRKGYLPTEYEKSVQKILENAFKRFLHHPNKTLNKMSSSAEIDIFVSVIKRLLGDNDLKIDMNKCEYHMEKGIFK
jgi:glutamyl-tRNA reductase